MIEQPNIHEFGRIVQPTCEYEKEKAVRIAGGVIAVVVGLIQFIVWGFAVFLSEGLNAVTGAVATNAEREAQGSGAAEAYAAANTAQAVDSAVGAAATLSWMFFLMGLGTFVLGIMMLAMRSRPVGVALAAVGVVGIAIVLVLGGGSTGIVWSGLVVLGGVLGWLGAKPQTAAA